MKNADQPAFPIQRKVVVQTTQGYADTKIDPISGLTKREYIAIKMIAALAPAYHNSREGKATLLIREGLRLTDVLLEALSQPAPEHLNT
jgi:hypothetical protein